MLDDVIAQDVKRLTTAASAKQPAEAFDALWRLAPLATKLAADPAVRAKVATVVYELGLELKEAQRLDAAEECLRTGHQLAREAGDAQLEASAANHLGVLGIEQGRLAFARSWLEAALRLRIAAAPALTDPATVSLAGAEVNLGAVAQDARDLDRATAHFENAAKRLEEARAAGSHVGLLGPYLANAERGAARTAEMRSWTFPAPSATTAAPLPSSNGLASETIATWAGRRDEALASGDERIAVFALGGFLDSAGAPSPWLEEEHQRALELLDQLLLETPRDAELRLVKARILERRAHAAKAQGRAAAASRDTMAPDVLSTVLDVHARQFRGALARMQDAFVSAGKVAPASEAVAAEAAAAVERLTARAKPAS